MIAGRGVGGTGGVWGGSTGAANTDAARAKAARTETNRIVKGECKGEWGERDRDKSLERTRNVLCLI